MSIQSGSRPEFAASELTYAVTAVSSSSSLKGTRSATSSGSWCGTSTMLAAARSRSPSARRLEVHGNGRVIDQAGWRRLSVMLGTGRVVGENRDVPQKVNGIGSKNHGLRSLFLIGNEIYIRSGGYQTVLDLRRGALREPRLDPASTSSPAHILRPLPAGTGRTDWKRTAPSERPGMSHCSLIT